jgi:hypothetical protein
MNISHKTIGEDGRITNRSLGLEELWRAETFHILSVGPVDHNFVVHDVLLEAPNLRLSIVADYRELWEFPKQQAIHVVILHDTLSSFELEAACQLIRRAWPQAGILVVRSGEDFLDDALYDDRVMPAEAPEVLLTTIERLIGERHERRFGNDEL